MQYRKHTGYVLSVLIIMLAFSCKKKANVNLSTIKIATVLRSEFGGGPASPVSRFYYRITYDTYNNVDSIVSTGGGTDTGFTALSKFTYVGSSFTITDQNGLSYMVDANTNGQILKVLTTDTLLMTYNGTELTELDNNPPGTASLDTTTYQWYNGDIASYTIHGVVDSYYYNTGRSGQEGDALRIEKFLQYGRSYISTSHLPDELTFAGSWIELYFYKFDGEGRVSQLTKVINEGPAPNTNDTITYAYTYY